MVAVVAVVICATVLAGVWIYTQHAYSMEYMRHRKEVDVDDLVHEKSTVVVNLLTGDAVRGVVLRSTRTFVELGEGRYLGSGAEVSTSGVIRVPRTNVLFVQDVTERANTD